MGRKSIADIRRKEFTEAFFKVVAEKGLAGATVREITEAAGFSQGMLHHYFANKEAMVLEVMDYVVTTYMAEFQEGILKCDTAADRLKFVIFWFNDLNRFNLDFSRAWMEFWVFSKANQGVSKALQECYKTVKNIIFHIIRDGMRTGEFRKVNPVIVANLLLACMEGSTMLWVVDTKATPVKSMGKQTIELFLHHLVK